MRGGRSHGTEGWRLVCDLGGTNVRFARADGAMLSKAWSASLSDYACFEDAMTQALANMACGQPQIIAIGAAGPIDGTHVKLTNAPWVLEASSLSAAAGNADVLFFNDLQPVARAIPALMPEDLETVRAGAVLPSAARIAINVGTGFGAAALYETDGGSLSTATEAGHMTLPATVIRDAPEISGLGTTVEDLLSGAGITFIYHQLAGSYSASSAATNSFSAAEIFSSAAQDPIAMRCAEIFGYTLGLAVRDLILAHAAWGGVYLFGSVIGGWASTGRLDSFHDGLTALPAMEEHVSRVPVHRITRDDAALLGLALL